MSDITQDEPTANNDASDAQSGANATQQNAQTGTEADSQTQTNAEPESAEQTTQTQGGENTAGNENPQESDAKNDAENDAESGEESPQWPDDWRERMAGDNDKLLKQLNRYASPKAFADAHENLLKKLSSGEHKSTKPPENASEEEMSKWREEQGLPKKPEGYLENLPDGLNLGEDDKENFKGFLDKMHEANAPQEYINSAIQAYKEAEEQNAAAVMEEDKQAARQAEEALREEMGNAEYVRNKNLLDNFLTQNFPSELKDRLAEGRLSDGTPILADTDSVRSLMNLARELNPAGITTHGKGMDSAQSIESEIKDIEDKMKTQRSAYFKDEALQSRYRELLQARERYGTKNG